MKRAAVIGIVSAFVVIIAACKRGGGDHSCALDPEAGCVCKNETFPLASRQKPAAECSSPRDVTWDCCYDLDSKGETNECWCTRAICTKDSEGCRCQYAHRVLDGATLKAECVAETGQLCCEGELPGEGCDCRARTSCPGKRQPVDKCTPASAHSPTCSKHRGTSCDGLKWKSKT